MMEKIKDAVKYILAPLALVLGYIFYLTNKTKGLEGEIGRLKADKESDKLSEAFDRAKEKGNDSEKDWESIRGKYVGPDDGDKGGAA